ncbi:MAG: hypothetical protein H0W62_00145 [Chitinophagales bacterium]|nr:hypothetical protein [Chitinophagales bacterium]
MQVSSFTSSSKAGEEAIKIASPKYGVWRLMRNGMLLLCVIIAFDQVGGRFLHYMYFKQKTGPNAETTFTFTKMQQDAVILGSSRGRRNYNPQPIGDSLGIGCYNAGHDGQTIFYEEAIIRMVLSRYTPKLVVLDLNPEEMYYKDVHYDRLNVLAPYYSDYPQVRDIYLLKGNRNPDHDRIAYRLWPVNNEGIKMMSLIYRNNSAVLDILTGMFKNRKSDSGFKPLKGIITQQKANELIKENNNLRDTKGKIVDINKINGLEEILSTLTSRGAKVYVSMSPALTPFGMEPSYHSILDVCRKYNVAFKDYSQDAAYNHLDYFFDNHMNKDGANLFSVHLAHDIKQLYPELSNKQVAVSNTH